MTQLSDQDWELVNAYADGELSAEDVMAMQRRIEVEPEIFDAVQSVLQVLSALGSLKPHINTTPSAANSTKGPALWAMGGSIAAAVVLIVVLSAAFSSNGVHPTMIHQAYVSQNFNVLEGSELRNASGGTIDGFPLLGEANLTLAVTKTDADIASAHYVGVRGCRLTVLRGRGKAPEIPTSMQASSWIAGDNWYIALATGMDQKKFDTASEYLRHSTLKQLKQETLLAMTQAVSQAAPCSVG